MSKNYSNSNVISEKNHRGLFAFILAALISTTSYNAQAAVFLWNNTGTQWTSGTSWVGGVAPASTSSSTTTDEVQFGNVTANFNAVDITSNRSLQNLTFNANANAYTLGTTSAKYLEISKGLTNNSTATQTFNTMLYNANGSNTWTQVTGGTMVFNNGVSLGTSATSRTVTLAGGGTFNFNSAITQSTSTGSTLTVNNAGGVVNLNNVANSIGSSTGGGVTITAGRVNFSNAQSLGTGTLTLGNTTGALYGNSVLNNATGSAVTLTGITGVVWSGTAASGVGVQIGTAASTSANNINFGSGLVTAGTSRNMNIAGTGVTLTMGTLDSTTTSSTSVTFTVDGVGNTLILGGYKIRSAAPSSLDNRFDDLAGTANLTITGEIQNGNIYSNGLRVAGTGVTTFSGNNTYDGLTTKNGVAGTLTLSGNNSGAAGGVTLNAGTLNINNANALGTGLFSFGNSGDSTTINNTSGTAVVNAGNQAMTWNGTTRLNFGTAASTAANNLDLGTGTVTLTGTRGINLLGTGAKLTMGNLINGVGSTFTADGAGNTLEMRGLSLSTSATPVTVTLAGTANLNVTGAIVSGTTAGNSLTVSATGTTTLSGNNEYTGVTKMNGAGGTLTLSGNNSSATGGTTLDAGTLNIGNVNALSTGLLELSAATGSVYGSSIINNTSGGALTFSGLSGVKWSGATTSGNTGIQFGTSASTSANNMDFGTGLVSASTSRSMNIAGTGVTISMGTLTSSGTGASYDYIIDGAGNTLDLDGWKISGATTPIQAAIHKFKGSANMNIGKIENGTGSFANGVSFNSEGETRLTGNNTYTGTTEFIGSGTNIISGDNSAAVGNVTIAGVAGSGKLPYVRLDNVNGISSSSSLLGASGIAQTGTLDLKAAGNFSMNSFGLVGTAGNNMIFLNSSGSQKTLAFTAANNYITAASTGGRTLYNNSANLLLDFDGNIEIGGESSGGEATTFAGVGNFNVDGNLLDTGTGLTRTLRKQGDGTLTLRGSANSIRGSTLVETGTLDLYGNVTASTDIVVSTSGTSTTGARTVNSTLNVRSGASLLNSSSTTVWSRGNLIVNGTAGDVVVKNYGLLGGSGTVDAITLESGSFLTPGNSPGTLSATSASLLAGSTYNWEINSAAISASAGTNWDLLNVATVLDLSTLTTLSGGQLNLVLKSLDSAGLATTSLSDFTIDTAYTWVFAQAASINNANFTLGADVTDYFNISTTAFNNDALPAGYFKVQVGETTTEGGSTLKTLQLMTIPEPSTGSLLAFGLGGLVLTRLLRRKQS